MHICLTKGQGKPDTLVCTRDDGTRTWTRLHPALAAHDLTHFAVESVLGFRDGFFGLVAAGVNIRDFERPKAERPPLPLEASQAEFIVGLFQAERADGGAYDDFIEVARTTLAAHMLPLPPQLTPITVATIRSHVTGLLGDWAKRAPGESLHLNFNE